MEHEFFIHGKPNNADFFGSDEFNGLSKRISEEFFSSNSAKTPYLQAEIRQWMNNLYSIYTYCIPNLRDTSNRKSYLAVSLITNGFYCSRLSELYTFFEITYSVVCKKIKLIDSDGKYLVNTFAEADVSLLQESFLDEISKRFGSAFVAIPQVGNKFSSQEVPCFNPSDSDLSIVQTAMIEHGKILLSKEVETFAQKAAKADQLVDENSKLKQSIQNNQNFKTEIGNLKSQLDTANQDKTRLQVRVEDLEKEVKRYRDTKAQSEEELRSLANQLQEPLKKILDKFKMVGPETVKNNSIWLRVSRFVPVLNFLLLLLLGFLCYRWSGSLKNTPSENQTELIAELDRTKQQVLELQIENGDLKETIKRQKEQLASGSSTTTMPSSNTTLSTSTQTCTITITDPERNAIKSGTTLYEGTNVVLTASPKIDGYCWYGKRIRGIDGLEDASVTGTLVFYNSDNENNRDNQTVSVFYGPHRKKSNGKIDDNGIDETNKMTLIIKRK